MVDPDRTLHRRHGQARHRRHRLPGHLLQGRTVVGQGTELGPDTTWSTASGRRVRRRADRGARPEVGDGGSSGRSRCSSRDPRCRPAPAPAFYTGAWSTRPGPTTDQRRTMEQVSTKRFHLVAGRPTSRWRRRSRISSATSSAGQPRGLRQRRLHPPLRGVHPGQRRWLHPANALLHPGDMSVNGAIMQQLIMVDAARRASAKRHHGGVPLLRVRTPGPCKAEAVSPSPPSSSPTCSPSAGAAPSE